MGTEIYLSWKGATDADRGLVRIQTSVWMKKQNWLLRKLFKGAWYESDFVPFDFRVNLADFELLMVDYMEDRIQQVNSGFDVEVQMDMELSDEIASEIVEEFKSGEYELVVPAELTLEDEQVFLLGLAKTYALGLKLQNQGKEPELLISW